MLQPLVLFAQARDGVDKTAADLKARSELCLALQVGCGCNTKLLGLSSLLCRCALHASDQGLEVATRENNMVFAIHFSLCAGTILQGRRR